jgi:hypothetical protein
MDPAAAPALNSARCKVPSLDATDPPMDRITPLLKLRAPLGGQEIELQQHDLEGGGMSLLRTRIRERSRFTVFDIDPQTAAAWGEALVRWARAQDAT